MSRRNFSLLFFAVYLTVVTVLFLMPNAPDPDAGLTNFDKIAHSAVFFLLTLLLFRVLKRRVPLKIGVISAAVVSLAGYGVLIEFLQYFTGRSSEAGDIAADIAGIAAGTLLSIFFFD
jgi:VanZ family protein